MSDNPATYLHDHLAGSVAGLELVARVGQRRSNTARTALRPAVE